MKQFKHTEPTNTHKVANPVQVQGEESFVDPIDFSFDQQLNDLTDDLSAVQATLQTMEQAALEEKQQEAQEQQELAKEQAAKQSIQNKINERNFLKEAIGSLEVNFVERSVT